MQPTNKAEEPIYLYMNLRDEMLRIDIKHLIYFEGERSSLNIVCSNGIQHLVCMNLRQMSLLLTQNLGKHAAAFIRVGKSLIVNRHYIQLISIPSQTLLLSDAATFEFRLHASKEALRRLKSEIGNNSIHELINVLESEDCD